MRERQVSYLDHFARQVFIRSRTKNCNPDLALDNLIESNSPIQWHYWIDRKKLNGKINENSNSKNPIKKSNSTQWYRIIKLAPCSTSRNLTKKNRNHILPTQNSRKSIFYYAYIYAAYKYRFYGFSTQRKNTWLFDQRAFLIFFKTAFNHPKIVEILTMEFPQKIPNFPNKKKV